MDRHDRVTDIPTDRQTDQQADRQTDRQARTHIHPHPQTQKHTDAHACTEISKLAELREETSWGGDDVSEHCNTHASDSCNTLSCIRLTDASIVFRD